MSMHDDAYTLKYPIFRFLSTQLSSPLKVFWGDKFHGMKSGCHY
jgi:hypothetical protein